MVRRQVKSDAGASVAAATKKANAVAEATRDILEKQLNTVLASIRGDAGRTESDLREELKRRIEAENSLKELRGEIDGLRAEIHERDNALEEAKAAAPKLLLLPTDRHGKEMSKPTSAAHSKPGDIHSFALAMSNGQEANMAMLRSEGRPSSAPAVEAPGAACLQQGPRTPKWQPHLINSPPPGGSASAKCLTCGNVYPGDSTFCFNCGRKRDASPRSCSPSNRGIALNAVPAQVSALEASRPSPSPSRIASEGGMTDRSFNLWPSPLSGARH